MHPFKFLFAIFGALIMVPIALCVVYMVVSNGSVMEIAFFICVLIVLFSKK